MSEPSPLYIACAKCGGSGTYAPPMEPRGGGGFSQQFPGPCPDCRGIGALPTTEGAQLLNLVLRFTRAGRIEIPDKRA